jgi:hypothetical protein
MRNMHARVYWNLHKKTWSIQAKVGKSWKVVEHSDHVLLSGAEFKVSEAGRQRVLRDKRKNVHAMATGYLMATGQEAASVYDEYEDLPGVTYNPYKYSSFVLVADESPIRYARRAFMRHRSVRIIMEDA